MGQRAPAGLDRGELAERMARARSPAAPAAALPHALDPGLAGWRLAGLARAADPARPGGGTAALSAALTARGPPRPAIVATAKARRMARRRRCPAAGWPCPGVGPAATAPTARPGSCRFRRNSTAWTASRCA